MSIKSMKVIARRAIRAPCRRGTPEHAVSGNLERSSKQSPPPYSAVSAPTTSAPPTASSNLHATQQKPTPYAVTLPQSQTDKPQRTHPSSHPVSESRPAPSQAQTTQFLLPSSQDFTSGNPFTAKLNCCFGLNAAFYCFVVANHHPGLAKSTPLMR